MTTKKERDLLRTESINTLKGYLKEDSIVYTILKHTSASGMYRVISVYTIINNVPLNLDCYITDLDFRFDKKHEGIGVRGCGMDMGYDLVYNLSRILFNDGTKLNHRWLR